MTSEQPRLQIRTQHCTFCNHLLLATTRDLKILPTRTGEAKDRAIILPLEKNETELEDEDTNTNTTFKSQSKHVTLLLSTSIPDRRATLIRREDGIEKRVLVRCGRCRVVMGYFLDEVHYDGAGLQVRSAGEGEGEDEKRFPAVYVLPEAVVETDSMGGSGGDGKWKMWAGE
ncbi:hypothetical protein N7478_012662 [Penicillium angulare]|uniref:uncharacterized protein n=1 Tax=Penicillium angulare TaxID=116970 RepID=UPI002540DD1A|nr:uncharacterized protein N7478_012662 [Penicillium angulare]KAJ5256558.1 hypothetical protein N7478_012662 [Penicillium angulare]